MTEPTLESLNESAQACGYVYRDTLEPLILELIRAHAITLDKLHGRKEVSEAETFFREVTGARLGFSYDGIFFDENDRKAIALIEATFAELRLEWMADMVAPKDKFPNYRYTIRTSMT